MTEPKKKQDLVVTISIVIVVILLLAYNVFSYYGAQISLPGKEIRTIQGIDPVSNSQTSIDVSSGIVVVNFWATWCGGCVQEMPELVEISAKYKVVGVIRGPFRKDEFLALKIEYQNVLPDDEFFVSNYISVIPTTILLKDGIVKKVHSGMIDIKKIDDWVLSLNE